MTQEEKILDLAEKNNGTFTTSQIPYELAFEYRRAISMLRKRGYNILAEKVSRNNWRYTIGVVRYEDTGQAVFV